LTADAATELPKRLVSISTTPEGPLVLVDGQMVPSTWRLRMECSYCDHVAEVSLPHGLKTRSMASFGDSLLNHMKRHWVLSESETAALTREWSEPAR
jgi:hypothetical protein